jgi:hypothetical protein
MGTAAFIFIFALVGLGCSAASPEVARSAAATDVPSAPRSTPLIQLDLNLADDAIAAVDLWSDATAGQYAPELVVGDAPGARFRIELVDVTTGACEEQALPGHGIWGCFDGDARVIQISRDAPADMRVSIIAHELGHSLGLAHRAEGLMNSWRSPAEFLHPCVDLDTLVGLKANTGIVGNVACL